MKFLLFSGLTRFLRAFAFAPSAKTPVYPSAYLVFELAGWYACVGFFGYAQAAYVDNF